MEDMSPTEMRAILNAYPEGNARPRVHWCNVHLKKAWRENGRQRLPAEEDLGGEQGAWGRVRRQLDSLIDAESVDIFNERLLRMIAEWNGFEYHAWIEYFTRSYIPFREQWGGPWRKVSPGSSPKMHIERDLLTNVPKGLLSLHRRQ